MKRAGSRLGPYEIHSSIGAGGMGEVYRARDTRLDRVVALKVIAGAVAQDPAFRERFDREARAISALDHPHICTLYDVGHEDGTDFLVMQFLEGETLADRLARGARPKSDVSSGGSAATSTSLKGPLPLELTLRYGAQIASALDAAHKRGIIHRDLKPGNVILTRSGTKLLDFGLARLAEPPAISGLGDATRTVPLTAAGSIVGTLNYMSPEQLEGGAIDARTDIFAFGAVLYEMLSGRRAFAAESHAGLIATILNDETPSLDEIADAGSALPPSLHRATDRLVRKCLAKDPEDRWQSAADLAAELRWIDAERLRAIGRLEPESTAAIPSPPSRRRERVWMGVAAAALLALAGGASWIFLRPVPPPESVTFDIVTDSERFGATGAMAVSPDGRHVAVTIGATPETTKLMIRSLSSTVMVPVAGTEGASQPFWSPDSKSVAFTERAQSGSRVRRVDVTGRGLTTVAEDARGRGAWAAKGVIIFDRPQVGIFSVAENGGPLTPVTKVNADAGETDHMWPVFLPDGRRFLYMVRHRPAERHKNAIVLASLDSNESREILKANSNPELSAGHLLFSRDGTVYAQGFDAVTGRLSGEERPILEGVAHNPANGRVAFSAAANAPTLVYRLGRDLSSALNTMEWFDRSGTSLGILGGSESLNRTHAISPDGTRVAVARDEPDAKIDIYIVDVERNVTSRLISDPGDDMMPLWSPDGSRLYFTSSRKGGLNLFRRSLAGLPDDELLFESPDLKLPNAVSPDEQVLLFTQSGSNGLWFGRDIWALPLTGDRKPFAVVRTKYEEEEASFSPDGKWISYHSNDLGSWQVYVESFPVGSQRVRISTTSGFGAAWSKDGRSIFYRTSDDKIMAVEVAVSAGQLRPSTPRELFASDRLTGGSRKIEIDHRGSRFLLTTRLRAAEVAPLTVVTNWPAGFTPPSTRAR